MEKVTSMKQKITLWLENQSEEFFIKMVESRPFDLRFIKN